MRIVVHILLVVATVAILVLPFYLLARHFSRKYVKQEIGDSTKYATITLTDNEVIVKNETNLVWKTYSVHLFTKLRPRINEGFIYCQTGQESETVCTNLSEGKTKKFPLGNFYSFMPKVQYDKTWEISGMGITFTVPGSDEEYEYYQSTDSDKLEILR